MKIILSCYLGRSCARNIRGVSASPESTASGIEWRLLRFRMIIAQIFGAVKPSGYSSLTFFLEAVFLPLVKGVPLLPRLPFIFEQPVAVLDALGGRVAVVQLLLFGDCFGLLLD